MLAGLSGASGFFWLQNKSVTHRLATIGLFDAGAL
jgi:hypothetical protein